MRVPAAAVLLEPIRQSSISNSSHHSPSCEGLVAEPLLSSLLLCLFQNIDGILYQKKEVLLRDSYKLPDPDLRGPQAPSYLRVVTSTAPSISDTFSFPTASGGAP